MNIRLAQFGVCGAMMAATLGKTSGLRRQIGVMTMPVGKPWTVDSICLDVSVYIKTHLSGMFFPFLSTTTNDAT